MCVGWGGGGGGWAVSLSLPSPKRVILLSPGSILNGNL